VVRHCELSENQLGLKVISRVDAYRINTRKVLMLLVCKSEEPSLIVDGGCDGPSAKQAVWLDADLVIHIKC